ncbi:MAG: hypothetical protein JNM75_07915 [Rhodospirillales bacterium]|nr:hypothetical protein [Rhodospirillales bacterium]
MLNSRQTEALSRKGFRVPEAMEKRNQLPFERVRSSRRQNFSPFEVFLLAIHSEICRQWNLLVSEASTIVSESTPGIISEWPAFQKEEIWLVREIEPGAAEAKLWLMTKEGLLGHLEKSGKDQPRVEWSEEALKVERVLLERGLSQEQIYDAMWKIDGKKFVDAYKDRPQTLWLLHVSEILDGLREEAHRRRIKLPALDDLQAWLGKRS